MLMNVKSYLIPILLHIDFIHVGCAQLCWLSVGNQCDDRLTELLDPVVRNIVSLTLSLSHQFVSYISTSKANTLLFFVEKMCESFVIQKITVYL